MKKKNKIWIFSILITLLVLSLNNSCKKDVKNEDPTPTPVPTTVTDIDGNIYHTVTIGTQTWMVENLKTTKYRDGTAIQNVTDGTTWFTLTTGAYCNYAFNPTNSETYGRQYNWYAATDAHNICPTGWHLPTDADWVKLITYLGGGSIAGGKLKETGTNHWQSPNSGATNETGFTALPGGDLPTNMGGVHFIGGNGCWWSSTEYSASEAWKIYMVFDKTTAERSYSSKSCGSSIRCIMD